MNVEFHDKLKSPEKKTTSRVVVYDSNDNPIAVFMQISPTHIYARTIGQPGFVEALRQLGVTQTTIVEQVRAKDLSPRDEV